MESQCRRKSPGIFALLFISILLTASVHAQNMFRRVNDFDGDGKADFAVTRLDENGLKQWWILQTTAGPKVIQWGMVSDRNAAGDYDGDGKTDVAVWRAPGANQNFTTFYILESATNTFRFHSFFSFIVSQQMQQDYNGDGKTDPAVQTGETNITLSIVYSGSGSTLVSHFPANHFLGLRLGDMDGDGRADRATLSSVGGNNIKITNLETNVSRDVQFGLFTDQFQLADFDGDGIGDLTVFRESNGTWWWLRSSDGGIQAAQWGSPGDVPVPADYDGDGKTDLAIWRDGFYWVNGSQNGLIVVNWGLPTDTVVTY